MIETCFKGKEAIMKGSLQMFLCLTSISGCIKKQENINVNITFWFFELNSDNGNNI